MAPHADPVTLLNCDNVRHNGERFHDGLVEFLERVGKHDVVAWLRNNTTCLNTMVDRKTPRPSTDLPARVRKQTGIEDKAPVMGETFIQWVVKDNFRDVWPDLDAVGGDGGLGGSLRVGKNLYSQRVAQLHRMGWNAHWPTIYP